MSKLTSFLGDAVDAASNLNESIAKVNVVFGEGSEEVRAWGKTMASAFGVSNQAALEAAGTYGNLFIAFGIGQQEATKMSMTLVELAADLASFNNTSIDDALLALRSGLSGETEPLKRYGIAISEARMRTELMAQGVTNLGATLTPLQKTTAAYALIMKDSALAQGDSARSAEGLAMQQKFLEAEMADLTAEIGTELLPIMLALTTWFRNEGIPLIKTFMKELGNLGKVIGDVVGWMGDIGQAWATVGMDFGDMGDKIHDIADRAGSDFQTVKDKIKVYMLEAGMSFADAADRVAAEMGLMTPAVAEAFRETREEAAGGMADIHEAMAGGATQVVAAANQAIVAPVTAAMQEARRKAYEESRAIPGDISRALIDGRADVKSGLADLKALMSESLSDTKKIAYYEGVLGSKALADGLVDERADVRAAAMQLQADAEYQLRLLKSGAADAAVDAGSTFAEQLRLQSVAASSAGQAIRLRAAKELSMTVEFADGGEAVGTAWANALVGALNRNLTRIDVPLSRYAGKMIGLSPPKEGPLKDIDKGGFNIGKAWIEGFNLGLGGDLKLPGMPGVNGGGSLGPMAGGASTINNTWNLTIGGVQYPFKTRDDFIKALDDVSRFGGEGRLPSG